MKRRSMIVSAMLCLLLAGATLAEADRGQGRGDRKGDRATKSEEKSTKHSREQQVTRKRASDRHAVETRRDSRAVRERSTTRYRRVDEREVVRTTTPSGWFNYARRGREQRSAWDGHRAGDWTSEHRSWRARGGYYGYRLPERRYHLVFGPSHRFRVARHPLVIVHGYPRFYYSGYWVTLVDPWPEYWDDYWFAQDDCYIVYDDGGYYLTNARYPRVRIAVSFTLG